MIKKVCCLCLLSLICIGCSDTGSFKDGTMNLVELYEDVLSEIKDENLDMGILQETSIDASTLEMEYGIKVEDILDFVVYQSIIPADCSEIAIFHIKEEKKIIEDGIHFRINQMKDEQSLLPVKLAIIEDYQIVEIGEYMIYVSGVDAQKVIQYISSR